MSKRNVVCFDAFKWLMYLIFVICVPGYLRPSWGQTWGTLGSTLFFKKKQLFFQLFFNFFPTFFQLFSNFFPTFFATFSNFFCNFFATFLQLFATFFATFLQLFCNFFCNFCTTFSKLFLQEWYTRVIFTVAPVQA